MISSQTTEGSIPPKHNTPNDKTKRIENNISLTLPEVVHSDKSNWDACGAEINRHMIVFLFQSFLATCVIILCSIQLIRGVDGTIYFSLLSSTVTLFMPNPHLKNIR